MVTKDILSPTPAIPLGIIDVGSNSIKLLVVSPGARGLNVIAEAIEQTRISAGISGSPPVLSDAAIEAGARAVENLYREGQTAGAREWCAVATSAVRDAINRDRFIKAVRRATGLELKVLDGADEARLIALGAGCDPSVAALRDFRLIDLGGGSLECIRFEDGAVTQAISLPFGAVRMTERFLTRLDDPLDSDELEAITRYIRQTLDDLEIQLDQPVLPLVAAGGGFQVARQVWMASPDSYKMSDNQVPLSWLKQWRLTLASMSLADRIRIPGMPAERADIMPAAVQVMVTFAHDARQDRFHITPFNLRYGIAREVMEGSG